MADGLITVAELREIFDISSDIKTARLERHLVAAGRRMREWVGDEAYDDALSATPDDETRQEALELAEAHLAMHYAILGINTALRARGLTKTEKSEAGNTVLQYHTPAEIAKLQQVYLETAESLAGVYLLAADDTPEPFGIAVVSDDCDAEAATRCC